MEPEGARVEVLAAACADQSKHRVPSIHRVAMVTAGAGAEECSRLEPMEFLQAAGKLLQPSKGWSKPAAQ